MAEEETKLKVLVCDDDVVTRDLLSVNLKKLSCDVDCVDNGNELLDRLRLKDYDLLFLDILLPGKDGVSLLKEIKENKPQTAVIMITAYVVEESKAKDIGAADYLYKPFDWDKIHWIIDRAKRRKGEDLKMITQIGIIAGEIWHHLEQKGTSMLSEIIANLEHPQDHILMSLGWLSREGHVVMEKISDDYRISLRDSKPEGE